VHLRLFLLLSFAGPAVGSAGRSPQLLTLLLGEKCGGRSHALSLLSARSVYYWSPFLARWLSLSDRERRILLLISLLGFCRCLCPVFCRNSYCPLSELVLRCALNVCTTDRVPSVFSGRGGIVGSLRIVGSPSLLRMNHSPRA